MKKSILVLSIVAIALVWIIVWLAVTIIFKAGTVSNNLTEVHREYIDAFWVEDDDIKAYQVLKSNAEKMMAEHQNRLLTREELNTEMKIMTDYAAMATNLYPAEGMRIFAQIYNNPSYTDYIRANALLHAMFFPVEKLGVDGFSVENVRDWIFAEGRFASVLEGTDFQGKVLESEREVFLASLIGLAKAEELADSNKLKAKIASLKYDLALNLLVEEMMAEKEVEVWTRMDSEVWDAEKLSQMQSMLADYSNLQQNLQNSFSDQQTYTKFIDELAHAAKNVLRSYTTMQAFGIETEELFNSLHQSTTEYLERYHSESDAIDKEQIEAYAGINAFYKACSYVMANDYNIDDETKINELNNILEPFLQLSHTDVRIFVVTKALGERREGACYQPFVIIGKKIPAFKSALIDGVGGWEASQFEQ